MFNKGILNGSKFKIPWGGQYNPNSIVGERLEWKKDQKNLIKKKISEIINKIIPHLIPFKTFLVWNPWKVLSRDTSRHHWYIVNKIILNPININNLLFLWWKFFTILTRKIIVPIAPVIGQGL